MLLDVLSWFVTKYIAEFAYIVIACGALMGLSVGLQIGISIYQMWFGKYRNITVWQPAFVQQHSGSKSMDEAA